MDEWINEQTNEKERDRETDRQTDRQTDRLRKRETLFLGFLAWNLRAHFWEQILHLKIWKEKFLTPGLVLEKGRGNLSNILYVYMPNIRTDNT